MITTSIKITRTATLPDPLKTQRYLKYPELGPKLLFLSGGSALSTFNRQLKNYTHNSIHLVTPFDSGGSSAEIRRAFNLPSVGDLRSCMMALADESVLSHPEIYQLFTQRLPTTGPQQQLCQYLYQLAQGHADEIREVSSPMREFICNQLGYFIRAMPEDFDLHGASIGNLILTGGAINNHHQLDPIIFLFSKLVNVLGTVTTIVDDNLHLAAKLNDGRQLIGQHLLTGKQVPAIDSPIHKLQLSASLEQLQPVKTRLNERNQQLIKSAELICLPPGSFYSSLCANLLPAGVGKAIAANHCPKVYIPNLGNDPEQLGMNMAQSIDKLLTLLSRELSSIKSPLINFVLVDRRNGRYASEIPDEIFFRQHGIRLIDTPLVSEHSQPYYDNELLCNALLAMT